MPQDPVYQLQAAVDFGGVSIGDQTASIGFAIDRDACTLDEADELFASRRLEGVLRLKSPAQRPLPGMEAEIPEITATFDVKAFAVNSKTIRCRATFALSAVSVQTLSLFAKQSGTVALNHVADLDDDEAAENATAFVEAEGQAKLFGTKARAKAADVQRATAKGDHGAAADVAGLGLPKGLTENIRAAGCKTVGDLEHFMRSSEWWHRDIKGVGEKGVDRILDALLVFRQANPVPAEDESQEEAEQAAPPEPEDRECSDCGASYGAASVSSVCPSCGSRNYVVLEAAE